MPPKKLPDYTALALNVPTPEAPKGEEPAEVPPAAPAPAPSPTGAGRQRGRPRVDRPVREVAQAFPLYLHPEGHRALKVYAAESGQKMHDMIMEALEGWCRKKGITQPMRVDGAESSGRKR